MSKSTAQKKRNRLIREGRPDPAMNRLDWHGTNPVTKTTPTFAESRFKQVNKHKTRNLNLLRGDDSFSNYSA
ncbi:uracil phosphoribosyltransferase [Paenibacillus aestuarii]|uniref:Uracil phosphoribosyltransferase n=1 Tax=Paenibacillus aestuarii TaxID=516965 RepID=A0ABW0K554_9BACL|nr:uracil phosphoribosyltransferase [Paenibacillus aestuarii]